jgi:hypothetical protein
MTQPKQTPEAPSLGLDDPRKQRPPADPAQGIDLHPEVELLPGPTEASNPRGGQRLEEPEGPALVDPTVREPGPVGP